MEHFKVRLSSEKCFFLLFRYLFVTLPGNTVLVLKGFDCRLQVTLPQHPVLDLQSISETHQGRPLQIFRLFVSTELQLYAFCRHQLILQAHLYLHYYFIVHVPHYFFLIVSTCPYPFLSLLRQHLYSPFGINKGLSHLITKAWSAERLSVPFNWVNIDFQMK